MDEEIKMVLNEIDDIERRLKMVSQNRPDNEVDVAILDDEIIQLENKLGVIRNHLNDLYQLRDYQEKSNHVFVEDLIDISPEKSMAIRYCVHCQYSE